MKNRIFPDSVLKNSSITFLPNNRYTRIIYFSVLLFIIAALISLFIIKIEISVSCAGYVKPEGERNTLTAPASGYLTLYRMRENMDVIRNDTLFIIKTDNIMSQIPFLKTRKSELQNLIADLNKLLVSSELMSVTPITSILTQDLLTYKSRHAEYILNLQVSEKNYVRDKKLYEAKALSLSEFEKTKEKYELAASNLTVFINQTRSQWANSKEQYNNELREINNKLSLLEVQSNETVVLAPISGTIQKLENVTDGIYVHSGQKIGELSPKGNLVVECYIMPKDIGLIYELQPCRIQVDAFNYNQWGILTGKVYRIAKDVTLSAAGNSQYAYYSVYCSLDSDILILKNGYEGKIKKGMTVNSRMFVTKRTIAELLYDKMDNWLNPKVNPK